MSTPVVGGTGLATATPVGGTLGPGIVPVWTSSDVTIATVPLVNPDPTGLTSPIAYVGPGTATITVSATLPGGNIIDGSAQATVPPVVVGEPTSFNVTIT